MKRKKNAAAITPNKPVPGSSSSLFLKIQTMQARTTTSQSQGMLSVTILLHRKASYWRSVVADRLIAISFVCFCVFLYIGYY
jgi:hypothetical protein